MKLTFTTLVRPLYSEADLHTHSKDELYIRSADDLHTYSKDELYIQSADDFHTHSKDELYIQSVDDLHTHSKDELYIQSADDLHTHSKDELYIQSADDLYTHHKVMNEIETSGMVVVLLWGFGEVGGLSISVLQSITCWSVECGVKQSLHTSQRKQFSWCVQGK